jgi:hypothetical protein
MPAWASIYEATKMAYWVKRILLKTGEIVTECELDPDENLFDGPVPVVGDELIVTCRGHKFAARVIWGNWPDRKIGNDKATVIPLRVEEI